jgi:hypothetical protein
MPGSDDANEKETELYKEAIDIVNKIVMEGERVLLEERRGCIALQDDSVTKSRV